MKLKGHCLSKISEASSKNLFCFYNTNSEKIKSELFHQVILDGHINETKHVALTMEFVDHEPKYSFYYNITSDRRSFHFTQSDLDNKEGLFHDYNLGLASYTWWQIVSKELEKFE